MARPLQRTRVSQESADTPACPTEGVRGVGHARLRPGVGRGLAHSQETAGDTTGAGTQGTEGLAVGRQGGLSSGPSCCAEHKV